MPTLTAMSTFAFVFVFCIFVVVIFILFVVKPFGLTPVVGDHGDHTHPRPNGPLERRGTDLHGEDRPRADHQQRQHDARDQGNEPHTTIHGWSPGKERKNRRHLRRVCGRQYPAVLL